MIKFSTPLIWAIGLLAVASAGFFTSLFIEAFYEEKSLEYRSILYKELRQLIIGSLVLVFLVGIIFG